MSPGVGTVCVVSACMCGCVCRCACVSEWVVGCEWASECVSVSHTDACKSTISGQIMKPTGQVDERTLERYEKEAKEAGRESWCVHCLCVCCPYEDRNVGDAVGKKTLAVSLGVCSVCV